MGNKTTAENWASRERLRIIEVLLWWRGWVGRNDLIEGFGISLAQASGDLQRYLEMNPNSMTYHTSRKRYLAVENLSTIFHEPRMEEAISLFLGADALHGTPAIGAESDRIGLVSLPARTAKSQITRRVFNALLAQREIKVHYTSLSSGKAGWRTIVPHALGWDGRRWHVRAWSPEHSEWRDFVLGRISKAEWPGEIINNLPADEAWEKWEEVRLKINPSLSANAQEALKLDYGIKGDGLKIKVRKAMKPYVLAELFLTDSEGKAQPNHFILDQKSGK